MADLSRTGASSSALDLKGSNNLTDHVPPPLPSPEHLRALGISDHERFYREVSQRTSSEETLLDFHSRKMILGRKTSRSTMETPSGQLEQGKSKETEFPKETELLRELSQKDISSLQSFAYSLEQNQVALQGFRKLLNDKKAIEGMKNLMQDEEFIKRSLSELRDEKSVKHAISLLENEVSNGTCTKWYKKYTKPGSVYYHECCKDEGNNSCKENVKKDKGRLAGYILGSIYGYSAICWAAICCCATRCCQDDDSAATVRAITTIAVCPWTLFSPSRTDQNPPAGSVEMPQRQNDQSEVQQQDARREAGLSSRAGGSSSEVPRNDQREIQRQDSFHDTGPLIHTDSSSSDEEEPIAQPKYSRISMLFREPPTYVNRNDQREIQRHDTGHLSHTDSSSSDEEEPIAQPKYSHISMLFREPPI